MNNVIYVLLGGLGGVDGEIDSRGMYALADRLKPYGDVRVRYWSSVDNGAVAKEIKQLPPDTRLMLIGYSGGGSRATWLAKQIYPKRVRLIVGYDPSPWWQMYLLKDNVDWAITYYNAHPAMPSFYGWLGGGKMRGNAKLMETLNINQGKGEQHLLVDYDEYLHQHTINAVAKASRVDAQGATA